MTDPTRDPIAAQEWPERFVAHVVEPGPRPGLRGYDLHGDLARHYGFLDIALTAFGPDLPADPIRAARLDVALRFLSSVTVLDAAVHAGRLARVCQSEASGTIGCVAVVLAEQAAAFRTAMAPVLAWLEAPAGSPPPTSARASTDVERRSVADLAAALDAVGAAIPWPEDADLGLDAALTATLRAAGVVEAPRLETVLVMARLPTAIAETWAVRPGRFRAYPTLKPRFQHDPQDEP